MSLPIGGCRRCPREGRSVPAGWCGQRRSGIDTDGGKGDRGSWLRVGLGRRARRALRRLRLELPVLARRALPGRRRRRPSRAVHALTFLAAVTEHIRLGTGICLVPQRNPVYTAKQVVDLDTLSPVGSTSAWAPAGSRGVRRAGSPVRATGRSHARAHRGDEGPVERRRLRVPRRALRAPELSDVPEAGPATSPAHPRRR